RVQPGRRAPAVGAPLLSGGADLVAVVDGFAFDLRRPGVTQVDLDALWLALLWLGDRDLEDAGFEARLDGPGVDALGEGQGPAEGAGGTLDAVVALAVV